MCGRCGSSQTTPTPPPSQVGTPTASGYIAAPAGSLASSVQTLPGVTVTASAPEKGYPWWVWLVGAVVVFELFERRR